MEFSLRPISPGDKAALVAAWDQVSPESQRRRFLSPHPRLSGRELAYFTEVDGWNHVAWVATPAEDRDTILGVGRWVRLAGAPDTAEFAVVVGDAMQGGGIGTALLDRLVADAEERGIRAFTAQVLADNEPVRRLLARLGRTLERERHGAVDELRVQLAA